MLIALISLGCPKALVDSEKIIALLQKNGYQVTADAKAADLVVVNTCGFINEAIQESLDAICQALADNGNVIVTGCLGARQELILQHYPEVLAITGPASATAVVKLVKKFAPIIKPKKLIVERITKLTPKHYAYLKIAEGCNQRCSYCIIPQLRGRLHSRSSTAILHEAKDLVHAGAKELLLIAQDLGAYGSDLKPKTNLLKLLSKLSELGVWLRLHYLYPYDFLDEIVAMMAQGKILPYLDVPLQHVNQRILKLMRRPALDSANILERIAKWRKICPGLVIRSTFIVGFPSETAKEFQELLNFLQQAKLDRVGCFPYSPVAGARANDIKPQISEAVKRKRFRQLMSIQQIISKTNLQTQVGKELRVLVDEVDKDFAIGRSYMDAPEVDGQVIIQAPQKKIAVGDFVMVKIVAASEYDLYGQL